MFQYHPSDGSKDSLGQVISHLLSLSRRPVNFLISIGEESLALLDRFKGQVPNIFANYLRLSHLTRAAARQAILNPITKYNRLASIREQVVFNPALAEDVIEDLIDGSIDAGDRIEASYLQLVMTTWWSREVRQDPPWVFHSETLGELGGAAHIYRNHFRATMNGFRSDEQDAAARMFRLLVAPSGRKIALTVYELVESTFIDAVVISRILDDLRRARILASVPTPRGAPLTDQCYEVAHDVVAKAALAWQREFTTNQRMLRAGPSNFRRYQVFIASTFRDLAAERKAAVDAVFTAGHIPITLERFSLDSENDLRVIKNALRECQIFILIMSSRYGTLAPRTEMSFTELEYNLALELGLVVLAFMPDSYEMANRRNQLNPNSLLDKTELGSGARLDAFRRRVSQSFYSTYKSGDDFKYVVSLALHNTLKDLDRPGLIQEPVVPMLLEASKNEFIVDIVQQLRGFGKLFDRSATEVEKKRELARFFVATYLDRIRLHNVSFCSAVLARWGESPASNHRGSESGGTVGSRRRQSGNVQRRHETTPEPGRGPASRSTDSSA